MVLLQSQNHHFLRVVCLPSALGMKLSLSVTNRKKMERNLGPPSTPLIADNGACECAALLTLQSKPYHQGKGSAVTTIFFLQKGKWDLDASILLVFGKVESRW